MDEIPVNGHDDEAAAAQAKAEIDQRAQALFNGTMINMFHTSTLLPEGKDHVALFAVARALGELAGLLFGKSNTLVADLREAMEGKLGEMLMLTEDARAQKIQALIIAARNAAVQYEALQAKAATPKIVVASHGPRGRRGRH